MRVADVTRFHWASRQLAATNASYQEASVQATTGRRVNKPSDDPVAAAAEVRNRTRLEQTQAYRKNVSLVRGDVELAEGVLAEAGDILQRIRELGVQGANGSVSAEQRATMAEEVETLRQSLVGLANTRGARGTLFGGTQTDEAAFDDAGNFLGNDLEHRVSVGSSGPVTVNPSGAQAFTAAGGHEVFAEIAALRDALASNDQTAIQGRLDTIDASHDQVVRARSQTGMILERLSTSDAALEQMEVGLQSTGEDLVGIEAHEAYSNLVSVGQAVERSIAVARQILDIGSIDRF